MKQYIKSVNKKYIIILFLIIIPWTNSLANNNLKAAIPSQEDLSFYEINPCEVSLLNFLINNPNSIYQDHYSFVFNNYSSIKCFGKVTGLSLIDNGFVISIGTNTLIGFLIQSLFWISLISLIRVDKKFYIKKNLNYFFLHLLTSLVVSLLIYSEYRYYESNLYLIDINNLSSMMIIYFLICFVSIQLFDVFSKRVHALSNFIPIIFLINAVFNGFNFSLFMIIFIFLGIDSIFKTKQLIKFNKIYIAFSFIWVFNASKSYYVAPSKLRGFSSSLYEFNSVFSWTLITFLIINGIYYYFNLNKYRFTSEKFTNVFSVSSILIFLLSLISANFPIFNFLNYFYFGHQRFGIKTNNPFERNEWGEVISWRGFYSSAESIGELYGLAILFIIFQYFKHRKISFLNCIGLLFALLGLIASNNRTVLILLLVITCIYLYKFLSIPLYQKYTILTLSVVGIIVLIGLQNLNYSYNFTSMQMYAEALNYGSINSSSYLNLLMKNYDRSSIYSIFFGFLSSIAFILNRAEVWGLFFARFNPTFSEFIFGTGPFNFGQFYGEIKVLDTRSFLLPHSSILSLLLFVGVIGLTLLIGLLIYHLFKNKKLINLENKVLILFVFINLIKNDTVNYFPSFLLYFFILYIGLFGNIFSIESSRKN